MKKFTSRLCVFRRGVLRRRPIMTGSSRLFVVFLVSLIFVYVIVIFGFKFHNADSVYNSEKSNPIVFSVQPNKTWMKLRKELLSRPNTTSKVVLLGYMRGGTSVFSEIFNLNPDSDILWHEPMDAFYQWYAALHPHSIPLDLLYHKNLTRRMLSDHERSEIIEYLYNLLNCRPQSIPMETFAHAYIGHSSALKPVFTCMETSRAKVLIHACTEPLGPICGNEDTARRNMDVCFENKCPEIVAAIRSLLLVSSDDGDLADNSGTGETFRDRVLRRLVERFSGEVGKNSSHAKYVIERILDRQLCVERLKPVLSDCVRPAFNVCRNAKLSALKLIRVMFDHLEELIARIPDISVIHYVRDPRAIAISRANPEARLTMSNADRSPVTETRILCRRMAEDLTAKRYLESKYPGAISTVRYEDFVRRPRKHAAEVFRNIRRPLPTDIHGWIKVKFSGDADNGIYGTIRADPVLTSGKWMSETTLKTALEMEDNCHGVLRDFGYFTVSADKAVEGGETSLPTSTSKLTVTRKV